VGIPNMLDSGGLPQECLADLLGEHGYNSVFFENATEDFQRRGDLVRAFGYEDFYPLERLEDEGYTEGFQRANYFGYEDDVLLEPSRDWLSGNSDEPFLASYETITPHHEYLAPDTYGIKDFAEDDELNRYLNSVRYVDFFLRNLIEQYKELGLYEDTVFVIYADHGEAFGEHGETGHGNVIYEEATRIPLMIHDPRNPAPIRVEEAANHLDLTPTILDLLGYEPQNVGYEGRSLYSLTEERPLNLSCEDDEVCLARIEDGMKLIHYFGESPDELYDLKEDPREENNLARDRLRDVEEMRSRLLEWRTDNIAKYEEVKSR
jgi:lipoteichoic acid synthase